MALFDAVQRRAGLLGFKQPLQPPRRGYSDDMVEIIKSGGAFGQGQRIDAG